MKALLKLFLFVAKAGLLLFGVWMLDLKHKGMINVPWLWCASPLTFLVGVWSAQRFFKSSEE